MTEPNPPSFYHQPRSALPPNAIGANQQQPWYPPQPVFDYPVYGTPPFAPRPAPPTNGLAVGALIVGVGAAVALFTSWLFFFVTIPIALIAGITGLILGIIAMGQIKRSNGASGGHGMALAGTITGAVTAVICLGLGLIVLVVATS